MIERRRIEFLANALSNAVIARKFGALNNDVGVVSVAGLAAFRCALAREGLGKLAATNASFGSAASIVPNGNGGHPTVMSLHPAG